VRKFVRRYHSMEETARREGVDLGDLAEEELVRRFRQAGASDRG
jgi:uncharacterized protein YabN with tetrapyrrole methylase and pyrophosphatase domain